MGSKHVQHLLCAKARLFSNRKVLLRLSFPFLKTPCGLVSWHTCQIFSLNLELQEVSISVFDVQDKVKTVLKKMKFKIKVIWQLLTLVDVVHSSVNISPAITELNNFVRRHWSSLLSEARHYWTFEFCEPTITLHFQTRPCAFCFYLQPHICLTKAPFHPPL